jgi:hypothetical protein
LGKLLPAFAITFFLGSESRGTHGHIVARRPFYWDMIADKQASTATNKHATIEKLLETVFSALVRPEEL